MSHKGASAAHIYSSGVFVDVLSRSLLGFRVAACSVHKLAAGLENKYSTMEHLSPSTSVSPTTVLLGDTSF